MGRGEKGEGERCKAVSRGRRWAWAEFLPRKSGNPPRMDDTFRKVNTLDQVPKEPRYIRTDKFRHLVENQEICMYLKTAVTRHLGHQDRRPE